jgi:hypothetical protein
MLLSFHTMAAMAFKTPELALDGEEAKMLAIATANVAKYYPTVIDERQVAWGNLIIVLIGVYGTRIAAVGMRRKRDRNATPKSTPPNNVFSMPGVS